MTVQQCVARPLMEQCASTQICIDEITSVIGAPFWTRQNRPLLYRTALVVRCQHVPDLVVAHVFQPIICLSDVLKDFVLLPATVMYHQHFIAGTLTSCSVLIWVASRKHFVLVAVLGQA